MDRQNSHHRPTAETNSPHANQWQVESPGVDTNDINEDVMGSPHPGSPDEVAKVALNANRSNSSNGETANHFLDSINDLNADSIARLANSGIPIEEVVANEHIQQVVIDETSRRINSIKNRGYDNDYYDDDYDDDDYDDNNYHDDNNDEHSSELFSADETGDLYRFKILDAICATDKGRQHLADSIISASRCEDIQHLGEEIESGILYGLDQQTIQGTTDNNLAENISKYNGVLRKLGWEPLKKDESLAELFYTDFTWRLGAEEQVKKSIDLQNKAYKLGLITPEVTDRLYNRQFDELFGKAKEGAGRELKNIDDYADYTSLSLSGYVVSPDLAPSNNNLMANYWRKQSGYLGNSAMRLCMAKALDMTKEGQGNGQKLYLSDLMDENGTLKDAFFQDRPGSFL